MKNTQSVAAREIPQIQEVTKSSNTQKPVKVADTLQTRSELTTDKVDLGKVPQLPLAYPNIISKPAKGIKSAPILAEIILPEDKSYIDLHAVEKYAKTSGEVMNLDIFQAIIMGSEDFETLKKVLLWCKQRPGGSLFTECLVSATGWHSDKLLKHDYFKNALKISFHNEGMVSFNPVPSERIVIPWNKIDTSSISLDSIVTRY